MIVKQGDRLINARNWIKLVKPDQISRDELSNEQYGKFEVEPLERGYGTTIGNALRRVLLSSLQGAALVSVKFSGVQHEFTTIPSILEDVTDIVLNLKQVRLAMDTDEPQKLTLSVDKAGPVTASEIKCTQHVEVLNPDQHLFTVTDPIELELEMEARMGKGYVSADQHEELSSEIGLIILDASFSPVRKVAYSIEQARVGQMTDFDKLVIEITTDGSVTPEDAIAYSAKILKDQLTVFISFDERIIASETEEEEEEEECDINENLFKAIDDLELSVRATNCLKSADISLVGELVQRTESQMLKTKNFGKKSLQEINRVLAEMDLELGMTFENFEKKYKDWKKRNQQNEAQ